MSNKSVDDMIDTVSLGIGVLAAVVVSIVLGRVIFRPKPQLLLLLVEKGADAAGDKVS